MVWLLSAVFGPPLVGRNKNIRQRITNIRSDKYGDRIVSILAEFYTESELQAALREAGLASSGRALRKRRELRLGPPFVKIGRKALYPRTAFVEWLHSEVVKPRRRS